MERPILYQPDMIRALLAKRKRQTRRLSGLTEINRSPDAWELTGLGNEHGSVTFHQKGGDRFLKLKCPYGGPGDHLWVRETWRKNPMLPPERRIQYRADGWAADPDIPWRPSIYLPRWASRILQRLVQVRVERVQEIRTSDALDEGIEALSSGHQGQTPEQAFQELWNQIHRKDKLTWEVNPWVWVLTCELISVTPPERRWPAEAEGDA